MSNLKQSWSLSFPTLIGSTLFIGQQKREKNRKSIHLLCLTLILIRIKKHVLSIEDEFLLVMMKLRLGLTNLDIAMRFRVSEGTVSNIFITWINFLYVTLSKDLSNMNTFCDWLFETIVISVYDSFFRNYISIFLFIIFNYYIYIYMDITH